MIKIGDKVHDKIHKQIGEVINIVSKPDDGHHAAFIVVKLDDGREVHLVEGQYSEK